MSAFSLKPENGISYIEDDIKSNIIRLVPNTDLVQKNKKSPRLV